MTVAGTDVLNHPAWHSAGQHAHLMRCSDRARRYLPDVAPFADVVDDSPESVAELVELLLPGEWVVIPRDVALREIPGLQNVRLENVHQLLAPFELPKPDRTDVVELTGADIPAMHALVDLTKPGPFEARTFELGHFYGIRSGGELVAMAGERMHPPGFCEVTAVCTHPDHRGAGHARRLIEVAQAGIAARGEHPFLHVFENNAPALRLYLAMGWTIRVTMEFTIAERAAL